MLIQGNSIKIPLADNSVHAVITSPPYWNLRDYSTGKWVGGSGDCDHTIGSQVGQTNTGQKSTSYVAGVRPGADTSHCLKCGAIRIDNQIGLEPTISAYVAVIVQVFREVKRVLHPSGVCFVNMGDSYSGGKNGRSAADGKAMGNDDRTFRDKPFSVTELPAKNLCMIPARVAIALQEDGWILRSEFPWLKKNSMPSSVTDRPGTAHEHVFMLVKSARYYYDMFAVRRPNVSIGRLKDKEPNFAPHQHIPGNDFGNKNRSGGDGVGYNPAGRAFRTSDPFFDSLDAYIAHLRDIRDNGGMLVDDEGMPAALVVNSESYKYSHYATFPRKLVAPLIKTTPEKCCPNCGAAWQRVIERTGHINKREPAHVPNGSQTKVDSTGWQPTTKATNQWRPTCKCGLSESECVGGIILDPFAGSGTVGQVATERGRRFIGIDLSARYLTENALPRSERLTSETSLSQLPLFNQNGGSDIALAEVA